ncbi:MAG TPA: hypothetical protein VIC25_08255 [Caulobacteraceae bacterium]|jgi:hypothetical protein
MFAKFIMLDSGRPIHINPLYVEQVRDGAEADTTAVYFTGRSQAIALQESLEMVMTQLFGAPAPAKLVSPAPAAAKAEPESEPAPATAPVKAVAAKARPKPKPRPKPLAAKLVPVAAETTNNGLIARF